MDGNIAFVPSDEHMRKLSEALTDLRDSLVRGSISLKDAQLELDVLQRLEVEMSCQQLFDKIQTKV